MSFFEDEEKRIDLLMEKQLQTFKSKVPKEYRLDLLYDALTLTELKENFDQYAIVEIQKLLDLKLDDCVITKENSYMESYCGKVTAWRVEADGDGYLIIENRNFGRYELCFEDIKSYAFRLKKQKNDVESGFIETNSVGYYIYSSDILKVNIESDSVYEPKVLWAGCFIDCDYFAAKRTRFFIDNIGCEKILISKCDNLQLGDGVMSKIATDTLTYRGQIIELRRKDEIAIKCSPEVTVFLPFQEIYHYVLRPLESNSDKTTGQQDHICKPKTIDHGFPNQKPWVVCPICGKEL